ncbi:RbsD/FucU transport protein family protein [Arenibacter algicola]|uniref:D-ribose pyranase n=1 Tax=Arenibacter algicola TaxID=616991 RepID=A0ABY3AGD7_9FLAO
MKYLLVAIGFFLGLMGCANPEKMSLNNALDIENTIKETDWRIEVEQKLKEYGHRNWIVVADAAYPKQSNPAIETITIDTDQLEAVAYISELIERSTHVDANIFVDKEMTFVAEKNATGIETYRNSLDSLLNGSPVKRMLHEDIIKELDKSAELFHILILKTNMTIPYTSVFFQLECGYWNAQSEGALRSAME